MPNPGDNKSVPAGADPAKPAEIRTFANFLETRGPDSEQYVSGLGDPGGRECAENPGPDGRPCACCIRYSRKPGCASYFPAQKCLLQMSKIRNRACGLWPFSHFSSFSFWPGRRPHLNLYPVSFAARNRSILIRLSAITPKPTQRCIPASPR